MRVLLFCAALLFPNLAIAQQIIKQGFTNGTATTGGCAGPTGPLNATIGGCIQTGASSSIWVNDCWSNGVLSLTSYNGSTTCTQATASSMSIALANIAGTSLNQSYCNVGSNPASYNTFTCSAATTPPAQNVRVYIYPTLAGATSCSGPPTVTQDIPAGVCTQIQGTGMPIPGSSTPNPALFVLGNCANGLVTSVIYNTSTCAVAFDSTGAISASVPVIPSGPWSQVNATSAAGKAINTPGASCSQPSPQAYFAYTCISTATTSPPTATPTPTPTSTPAPGNNTKGAASSVTTGAATFLALVIAAVANLL